MYSINNNNNLLSQPREILAHIFSFVDSKDSKSWRLLLVNKTFRDIAGQVLNPSIDNNKWLKWAVENERMIAVKSLLDNDKVQIVAGGRAFGRALSVAKDHEMVKPKKTDFLRNLINLAKNRNLSYSEYDSIIETAIQNQWEEELRFFTGKMLQNPSLREPIFLNALSFAIGYDSPVAIRAILDEVEKSQIKKEDLTQRTLYNLHILEEARKYAIEHQMSSVTSFLYEFLKD